MNVQTRKLNSPATNPSAEPNPVPSEMAAMMTGTCASVATSGPIGNEPSGVNATIASIATKTENCTRDKILRLWTDDVMPRTSQINVNCLHIIYCLRGYGK